MHSERMDHDIQLAKKIEAGLIAQEILDQGLDSPIATSVELQILATEGRQAKDDLILAHLGLVRVIAAEAAKKKSVPLADLFQEGCVAMQHAVMNFDYRKGPFGPYAGMWIRSAVRRISARPWVPLDNVELVDSKSAVVYDDSDNHEGLARVLQLIPPRQGEILRKRHGWDGSARTRKEIAAELGLTISKVRHLERKGLASMKELWELSQAA